MGGDNDPIVCRLMDYGKHLFAIKKKQAAARKRQRRTQIKEIKFRPSTDAADYMVKLRNLERFLSAGDKTKISIKLRGREMVRRDPAMALIDRIRKDLEEYGKVEQEPQIERRQLQIVLSPLARVRQAAKKPTQVNGQAAPEEGAQDQQDRGTEKEENKAPVAAVDKKKQAATSANSGSKVSKKAASAKGSSAKAAGASNKAAGAKAAGAKAAGAKATAGSAKAASATSSAKSATGAKKLATRASGKKNTAGAVRKKAANSKTGTANASN